MICVTASLMHGYCVDPTHARSVAPCGCYLTPCKKYWESTGSKKIPFYSKVVTNNPRIKFTLRCLRSKPIALPGSTHLPTSLPNSFYCMLTFTSSGHTRYQTRTFQHTFWLLFVTKIPRHYIICAGVIPWVLGTQGLCWQPKIWYDMQSSPAVAISCQELLDWRQASDTAMSSSDGSRLAGPRCPTVAAWQPQVTRSVPKRSDIWQCLRPLRWCTKEVRWRWTPHAEPRSALRTQAKSHCRRSSPFLPTALEAPNRERAGWQLLMTKVQLFTNV